MKEERRRLLAYVVTAAVLVLGVGAYALLASLDGDEGPLRRRASLPSRDPTQHLALARNGGIAFIRAGTLFCRGCVDADRANVSVLRPNGTRLRQLTGPFRGLTGLAWSPDGSRLALTNAFGDMVSIINAHGSGPHAIVSDPHHVVLWRASAPSWSPDGRSILFSMYRQRGGGPPQIYRVSPDGSGLTQVTRCRVGHCQGKGGFASSWSPDSKSVVFDQLDGLYLMESDGSHVRALARCRPHSCVYSMPAWSPDGSSIVFVEGRRSIWVIRPDGTGKRRVFGCGLPDCEAILFPTWSPDGKQVTFTLVTKTDSLQVAIVDADGSHFRLLDVGRFQACCAAWRPRPARRG